LILACENGQTAIAELLIAKGADMEAKDKVRQGDRVEGEDLKRHTTSETAIVGVRIR
jgi:ankyrin repeat protein